MPISGMRGSLAFAVLAGAIAVGVGAPAAAQSLPTEQCKTMAGEHAALVATGVPETLKKGPAWAKANLGPDKLKEVARYIGLEEQLLFRCGLAKVRKLPGAAGEDDGDGTAATDAATPAPAEPPPPVKKPQRKAQAKPKTDAAAADAAPAPSAPRPKAKPTPKADDAFRPPPKPPAEPASKAEQ
jgi:hypothetical protein